MRDPLLSFSSGALFPGTGKWDSVSVTMLSLSDTLSMTYDVCVPKLMPVTLPVYQKSVLSSNLVFIQ